MNRSITKTIILCIGLILCNKGYASNNFTAYAYQNSTGCSFNFRDTFLAYTPTTFYWNFGDGTTSSIQYPNHGYSVNGTYSITHIVSDGTNTDTAIFQLNVYCSQNLPLGADFDFNIIDSISASQVYFYERCVGTPTSFSWDFGDNATSNAQNPIHTYVSTLPQTYMVTLIASDGVSNDTMTKSVQILAFDSCKYFNAYFYSYRDTNCHRMIFGNQSHFTSTSFYWDFGDGGTSTLKSPTHLYANLGHYDVKLVSSSSSCSDTMEQNIEVTCRNCFSVTAAIDLVVDSTNASNALLYNYSTGIIGGHYWDFGDGSTSTASTPNHTYTSPGPIHLTYVVSDTGTCKDTAYIDFTIDSSGNIKRGSVSVSLQVIDRTNNSNSVVKLAKIESGLNVYPIPASDNLTINNTSNEIQTIMIFDVKGAIISNCQIGKKESMEINIQNWPKGLYFMISDKGERLKLMVE